MNKSESYKIVKRIFEKHAGIGNDMARGITTFFALPAASGRLTPGLSGQVALGQTLALPLGVAHGLASKIPTIEDIQRMDSNANRSFIPGVTSSRLLRRRRALRRLLYDKPEAMNLPVSEVTGQLTSPITSALLGGTIGGSNGAAYGLGIGAAGDALGALAALFTKRRSLEEQAKVENSKTRAILRHLIPGLAAYDMWKGLGATRNLSEEEPGKLYDDIRAIRENQDKLKNKD